MSHGPEAAVMTRKLVHRLFARQPNMVPKFTDATICWGCCRFVNVAKASQQTVRFGVSSSEKTAELHRGPENLRQTGGAIFITEADVGNPQTDNHCSSYHQQGNHLKASVKGFSPKVQSLGLREGSRLPGNTDFVPPQRICSASSGAGYHGG